MGFPTFFAHLLKTQGRNSVFNCTNWTNWILCRDVWLAIIRKSEEAGHWLLANDLYKHAMQLQSTLNSKNMKIEGSLWWDAANAAYKARDMPFAIYACHRSIEIDASNEEAKQAVAKWDKLRSGTPHHNDSYENAVNNVQSEFLSLETYLKMEQSSKSLSLSMKQEKRELNSKTRASTAQSEKSPSSKTHQRGNYIKRFRPLSGIERKIVQRLHEGTQITSLDRVLSGKLQTDESRFRNYLAIGLDKKNMNQSSMISSTIQLNRPHTSGALPRRNKLKTMPINRPSTAQINGKSFNRDYLRKHEQKMSGSMVEEVQKVGSWGVFGRKPPRLKPKKKSSPSKEEMKTSRSLSQVHKGKTKKAKKVVLASSLGLAVSYSGGAISGKIPESAHARPKESQRESRKQEVAFFKRLKEKSFEKRQAAIDYLNQLPMER